MHVGWRTLWPVIVLAICVASPSAASAAMARAERHGRRVIVRPGTINTPLEDPRWTTRRVPGFSRSQYDPLISELSAQYGVDSALIQAIIQAESSFDRYAVSRAGAQGLMQLMPITAARFSVHDTFDPAENIRGGIQYLRFLSDLFTNQLALILAAYNAGEGAVIRHKGVPPYAETQAYVDRVLGYYGQARSLVFPSAGQR